MKCKASFKNPGLPMLFLLLLAVFTIPPVMAGDAANTGQNPGYWIHLDPVSDKHVNDSFVISGTTNIPAGKPMKILIYNTVIGSMKNPPPRWQRESSIAILKGTGENNTFSTPLVKMTRSRVVDGRLEELFVGEEYCVLAGGENASDSTIFNIIAPETSQNVTPTPVVSSSVHPSAEVPATTPKKSPVSPVIAILSLLLTGFFFVLLKET